MSSTALTVRRAIATDIPFITATERRPGYEDLVGWWDAARHGAALADPRYAYFMAQDAETPVGFVILREWASPERVTLVKRIAVARPGAGVGRALLGRVIDIVFEQTDVHRLWISVYPENVRARHVYESLGFQAEGIARGSAYFNGAHRDELVLAQLRPDWQARRSAVR
jgi:RimJ/RimL family protein N-acetyltransferase